MPVRQPSQENRFIEVAIACPLRKTFDYLPSEGRQPFDYPLGCRVKASFGQRQVVGYVLAHKTTANVEVNQLKPLTSLLDPNPSLGSTQLKLANWMSDYYHHPIGDTIANFLPNLLKKVDASPAALSQRCWQITTHGLGLPDNALARAPKQQQLLNMLRANYAADIWLSDHLLKAEGHKIQAARELQNKGLIAAQQQAVQPTVCDSVINGTISTSALALNPEQKVALEQILATGENYSSTLLEGVTGSGKTEVYLQAIDAVLSLDKQIIVLVPEIGLTPQTIQRFACRFNCQISVFHSGLSDRERLIAWQAAQSGESRIVIGTRSAIFTPLVSPGLIIVDEEHDSSYKQQEGLRYHARDVAIMRARIESIPIVLGSATPSLESLHNAQKGKYAHYSLLQRAGNAKPPNLELVDIRNAPLHEGLSDYAIKAIAEALDARQQVMVFINRRGFAPLLICQDCGWHAECNQCDSKLTLHAAAKHMRCHHCDLITPLPTSCPRCLSNKIHYQGQGTERVSTALATLFPNRQIIRIDRDTARTKNAFAKHIATINNDQPLIMVGTQMLAKGHHFQSLHTVVMLDIDQGLYHPDFRGSEKTLQLLTQVAGRAGRVNKQGRILIQTHLPDHPLIQAWAHYGYQGISEQLIDERKANRLPPLGYIALIRADSKRPNQAMQYLQSLAKKSGLQTQSPLNTSAQLIGPLPAIMEKRAGRHRAQLLLKAASREVLHGSINQLIGFLENSKKPSGLRWSVDIDPQESV